MIEWNGLTTGQTFRIITSDKCDGCVLRVPDHWENKREGCLEVIKPSACFTRALVSSSCYVSSEIVIRCELLSPEEIMEVKLTV